MTGPAQLGFLTIQSKASVLLLGLGLGVGVGVGFGLGHVLHVSGQFFLNQLSSQSSE